MNLLPSPRISSKPAVWLGTSFLLTFVFIWWTLGTLRASAEVEETNSSIGYGFNVSAWDYGLLQSMGFNWLKGFNPPWSRAPVNVLIRVPADASHLGNLSGFGSSLFQQASNHKDFVEAYEIGNEPNLDASYGWAAAPDAAAYATLLCEAYSNIKAADPDAIVVSAGLAPTGRVQGSWNNHPGHNGFYQDEREFFKEFIAAGGGNCLDAVGYHPYGFSADFDAAPDTPSADPTQNCTNGFCFRGVEKLYELMAANGLAQKKVWATEFGWIIQPPAACLNDPGWQGRSWQIVSAEKQAANLVGAFQYAAANWPWMEAMFIFNLNFNTAGYPTCEQMRYYGVEGRPAESALRNMPKVTDPLIAQLDVSHTAVEKMITTAEQPFSKTEYITLDSSGTLTFSYTAVVVPGTLAPLVSNGAGTLPPESSSQLAVTLDSVARSAGVYTGTLVISATNNAVAEPVTIPVTLYVVDTVYPTYLPFSLAEIQVPAAIR